MTNLTENQKIIIRKGQEVSLEAGYDLVILEDKAFRLYQEGRLPEKKGLLSFNKPKVTEVFAVSTDKRHEISFRKPVPHVDGIHNFFVNITLRYAVLDPIQVIRQLRRDPVERLKDEAVKVVISFLRTASWDDISIPHRFLKLKSGALETFVSLGRNDAVPLFDRISEHAQEYGLRLAELDFDVTIPEDALEVEIKKDRYEKDKLISDAETGKNIYVKENKHKENLQEKDHENMLKAMDRTEELYDQINRTKINYIDTAGQNLAAGSRTIDDVKNILAGTLDIQNTIKGGTGSGSLSSGDRGPSLLGSGNSLVDSLQEILTQLKAASLDSNTLRTLLGVLFHMLGGKLHGEAEETMNTYLTPLENIQLSRELEEFFQAKFQEMKIRIDKNSIL